jgi:glycerol-3-phosphate acyltransferase PlsY
VSAALFPFAAYFLEHARGPTLAIEIGLAAFIIWKHRVNLRRLAAGTENRFGRRGSGAMTAAEPHEPAGRSS